MCIEGNEKMDTLTKETLKTEHIDIKVPLSKSEIKFIIKDTINKMWQDPSDQEETRRHTAFRKR